MLQVFKGDIKKTIWQNSQMALESYVTHTARIFCGKMDCIQLANGFIALVTVCWKVI